MAGEITDVFGDRFPPSPPSDAPPPPPDASIDQLLAVRTYYDTLRLIQGGAIDIVRPLLSCNDQPSIKIAE
jgi:hypothetical protein